MKRIAKIILLNLTVLAAGIAIMEVVWRVSYANDIRFSVNVLADTQYNTDVSTLYNADNNIISYSRDKYGFRGEYSQIEDIDILAIGGSTTDQRHIDDKKEWIYILANSPVLQGLDITLVNAGVDGQSSFGHIKNFDLWFSKIDSLQPKYILFYIGLNDFYNNANNPYDDLGQVETIKAVIKGSFSYYIYRLIKGIIMAKAHGIGHKAINYQAVKTTTTPLLEEGEYEPLMRTGLDAYLGRLKILVEKTRELGATPVFITQRTMKHWEENNQVIGIDEKYSYGNIDHNGVDNHYMEKLLNDTTMSICKDRSDSICINLASDIYFEQNDFYDFIHNTPSGAAKIGNYLANKIKPFY